MGFGIHYEHHPEFAPTAELLDQYKRGLDWPAYEARFKPILTDRRLESQAQKLPMKDKICLLCAEPQADRCHRRLVAEYLRSLQPGMESRRL